MDIPGVKTNPPILDLESPIRTHPVKYLIVHTAECAEYDGADDAVSRYLARATSASIHCSIDSNSCTPSVPEDRVAWAASTPRVNNYALQAEFVGRAGQGAYGWADDFSQGQLDVAARIYAHWAAEHDIPVRRGTPEDLRTGQPGFYGHVDSTRAFGNKDGHWDPGPDFPWDLFLEKVRHYLSGVNADTTPDETGVDNDMRYFIIDVREHPWGKAWLLVGSRKYQVDNAQGAILVKAAEEKQANVVNVGHQTHGSPYILLLDLASEA